MEAIKTGLSRFLDAEPDHEARITMAISMATLAPDEFDLDVFVEALPPLPSPPVAADIYTAERSNPSIKHTQWAVDRKPLEQKMSADANEVIMQDSLGKLYEGLSSNFFVLDSRDGKIHTAPDTLVLAGTIRGIVRDQSPSESLIHADLTLSPFIL
jgi:branched-subunit amino acid aminotransferase/4-amino-4-deoxychorismate lyase